MSECCVVLVYVSMLSHRIATFSPNVVNIMLVYLTNMMLCPWHELLILTVCGPQPVAVK